MNEISRLHYRETVRKSAFYESLKERDHTNTWYRWKEYTAPSELYDVGFEYFAIRNASSVFDVSPMSKYRITGPDAQAMLNRFITRDLRKIGVGRVAYTVWCNDEGQIIDDGTIFRLGENDYRLCAQERQLDALNRNALGFDVEVREETDDVAALSLQGPVSYAILRNMGLSGVENLKLFGIAYFPFDGTELMVSRTGFTGDLGYELWIDPKHAKALWDAIFKAGEHYALRAIGADALDIARIEAGFVQAGVDFVPASEAIRPGVTRSPFELGMDWLVSFDKGPFNGRRALLKEKEKGSRYRFVRLDIEGNKPAESSYIYADKKGNHHIGAVTSAVWSPSAKKNIALGYVEMPHGKVGDIVYAEIYYQKELKWRKIWAKCTVVDGPFWDPPRKRANPPGLF